MNVLVLGGGAREHALLWRLSRDAAVSKLYCAPGNAGINEIAHAAAIDPAAPEAVCDFVEKQNVALTVVGPELPLTRGVVDHLTERGHAVFGPTRAAAEIESSKVFAKDFMRRHNVPTADFETFVDAHAARSVLSSGRFSFPLVLKADGLAAGKGVIIADDKDTALDAIEKMMVSRQFGEAGDRILVEEFLQGTELSVFVIADGARAISFHTAHDHKRAYDDDRGPNTGGMGAFAPSPLVDDRLLDEIDRAIIGPTVSGLRSEARPFCGFLYAGLMLTAAGPKVLEFNARLGDPEAQVVLPLLDEDLFPVLLEAASGRLDRTACRFSSDVCVGVVLASGGYPGHYETGKKIVGLDEAASRPDVVVFHAGTARRGDDVVTSGGRVVTVVGRGADYATAMSKAYDAARRIHFDAVHYRTDIGAKALKGFL